MQHKQQLQYNFIILVVVGLNVTNDIYFASLTIIYLTSFFLFLFFLFINQQRLQPATFQSMYISIILYLIIEKQPRINSHIETETRQDKHLGASNWGGGLEDVLEARGID